MVFTNWKLTFWRGNPAVTNHTISKTRWFDWNICAITAHNRKWFKSFCFY
jgi:hypothetical protein